MTPDRRFDDLPPDAQLRIDAACDRFEAEWQAGRTPSLDPFLAAADPADRPALEAALRALDDEYRRATPAPPVRPADLITSPLAAPPAGSTDSGPPGRGAAAQVPPVPGYEVLEELGRGGMGVVHKARDTRLNRVVALKRILRADATRASVARFWAEAEVMAAVRHPHVVPVYELGEHDGLPFLAMEYLPGGSLADRVRAAAPMPPAAAAALVGKVAAGVAAAHEQGVVHRDLKPGNVLLDAAGEPKVTDFGLAKRRAADLTATQALMGTPAYMAPEQAAGRAKFVGPPADVWALGVILYECLTGKRPFAADTVESLLRQILSDDPVPLRTLTGRMPRDLDTVVSRCLAKEPADRYPTAAELAADLGRFARGEPIAARPVGPAERAARWVRRHPTQAAAWGLGAVAAGLLAVTVVIAGLWRDAAGARDSADAARGDLKTANTKLEGALTGERAAKGEAEQARDGEAAAKRQVVFLNYAQAVALAYHEYYANNLGRATQLLKSCPPDLRGWEWHYVHRLCHADLVTLTDRDGDRKNIRRASFSPDGRLVLTSSDQDTCVWDAETGRPLVTLKGTSWATFSPDGKRVVTNVGRAVSPADDGTLATIWDAQTGKQLVPIRGGNDRYAGVSFSPDGRRVVTVSNHVAKVWDAETGKQLAAIGKTEGGVLNGSMAPDGRRLAVAARGDADRGDSVARVWDVETRKVLVEFKGHTEPVTSVVFSGDGRRVVTRSDDRTARVWDAATGEEVAVLYGHTKALTSATFGPTGWVLTASEDGTARVWDPDTGESRSVLKGHTGPIQRAMFSPDGRSVLTVSGPGLMGGDRTTRIWDARSGGELIVLRGLGNWDAAFSADGTRVVTADDEDGAARIWDVSPDPGRGVLAGETGSFRNSDDTRMTLSADGLRLVGTVDPLQVRVWEPRGGQPVAGWPREKEYSPAEPSPDGRRVITVSATGVCRLNDTDTGREVVVLQRAATDPVPGVFSFSADGRRISGTAEDGPTHVWDVQTGREVGVFQGVRGTDHPSLSPDGERLVWTSHEGVERTFRVRDVTTGRDRVALRTDAAQTGPASHSPDGRWVVTAHSHEVFLREAATGRVAWTTRLSVGMFETARATFSPDSTRVVTFAGRGRDPVRIWDAATGTLMLTLPQPPGVVCQARFTADGARLVTVELLDEGGRFRVVEYDSRPVNRAFLRAGPVAGQNP